MKCSVELCHSSVLASGLCEMHYARKRRHGDPTFTKIRSSKRNAAQEFLRASALSTSNDCIKWPFATSEAGYGKVRFNGKYMSASRAVCILVNGPPPTPQHQAAHSCGQGHSACVNGGHLSWKTPAQNQADRVVHGTHIFGSMQSNARLTERDAAEIRHLHRLSGFTQKQIGDIFGVSQGAVQGVVSGRTWKHV